MSVRQVTEQIQHMNELHMQLLALGKTKRTVLMDNDLEKLSVIVREESTLAKRISSAEHEWLQAAKVFFARHGRTPTPELTVSDLLELVSDDKEKHELEQARSELMGTMHELKQVNALNQQLLEQSLALIDYTIELIAGAPEEMTYQNPNEYRSPEGRSVFDRKT